MLIAIHPDNFAGDSFSDSWITYFHAHDVETVIVDLRTSQGFNTAAGADGAMWRYVHSPQDKQSAGRILYALEHQYGVPTFPSWRHAWPFDEKINQYYLLQSLNAPVPDTWLYWDYGQALDFIQTANYPLVFKLSSGASGSNVQRIDTVEEASSLAWHMFHRGIFPRLWLPREATSLRRSASEMLTSWKSNVRGMVDRSKDAARYIFKSQFPPLPAHYWKPEFGYIYFQEYLAGNEFDTRIYVIGDHAGALRRLNRPGDFRASGSNRPDYDQAAIDLRCIEIAFDISRRGGFISMAYDFLMKEGQPVVSEMGYTFGAELPKGIPGWYRSDLTYEHGKRSPGELQAEAFLRYLNNLR